MKIVIFALVCIASVHCQGDTMPMPAEPQENADENAMLGARRQGPMRKMKKFRMQEAPVETPLEPQNTDAQQNMYREVHANPAGYYVRAPGNRAFRKHGLKHNKQAHGPVQPAHLLPPKEAETPAYEPAPTPAHKHAPAPVHYSAPAPTYHPAYYQAPAPAHYNPYGHHYARPVYHPHQPAHYGPPPAHYAPGPGPYYPQPVYAQPRKSPAGYHNRHHRHSPHNPEPDYVIPIPFELPPNPYCGACQGHVPQPQHQPRFHRDVKFENLTLTLNDGPDDNNDDHARPRLIKRSTDGNGDQKLPQRYDCYASDDKTNPKARAEFHFHVNEPTVGLAKKTTDEAVTDQPNLNKDNQQQPNEEIVASTSDNDTNRVRATLKERLQKLMQRDELVSSANSVGNSLQQKKERLRNGLRHKVKQLRPHKSHDQPLGSQQKLLAVIGDGLKNTVQNFKPEKAKAVGDQKDAMVSSAAGPKANEKLAGILKNIANNTVTNLQNSGDFVGSALSNITANLGPKGKTTGGVWNLSSNGEPASNSTLPERIKDTLEMMQPLARAQNMVQNLQEQTVGGPLNLARLPQPKSVASVPNLFRKIVRPQSQPGLVGAVQSMLGVQKTRPPGPLQKNVQRLRNLVGLTTTTTAKPDPPLKKMRKNGMTALKNTLEKVASTFQKNGKGNNRLKSRATKATEVPVIVGDSKKDTNTEKASRQETRAEKSNNRKKERQEAREARKLMVGARQKPTRRRHRHGRPVGKDQTDADAEKSKVVATPTTKTGELAMAKNSNGGQVPGASLGKSFEKVLGAVATAANRQGQQMTQMISKTADQFAAGSKTGDQLVGSKTPDTQGGPNLATNVEKMLGAVSKVANRQGHQLTQMISKTADKFTASKKPTESLVGDAQDKPTRARNPPKVVDAFAKILNAVASSMEEMTLQRKGDTPVAPIVSPIKDDIVGSSNNREDPGDQVRHAKVLPGNGASAKIVIPELVLEFPASTNNTVTVLSGGDSYVGSVHTGQAQVSVFNPDKDVSVLGNPTTESVQGLFDVSSPMHEGRRGKHKRGGLWGKRNRKLGSKEGSKESDRLGSSLEEGAGKKLRMNPRLDRVIVNPLGAADDEPTLGMGRKGKRLGKGSKERGSAELRKLKHRNRASNEARSAEKPGLGPKRKNFIKVKSQQGEGPGNKTPLAKAEKPKGLRRKQPKGRKSGSKEIADIVKELNNSEESKPSFESESQSQVCEKCKKLGGFSPEPALQVEKKPEPTLKKEEQPLIVLPDHLNPDKKTTEKPKQPDTTAVVKTTPAPTTTTKPKEVKKPLRPLFRSSSDLLTPKKYSPFRYTSIVASPKHDERALQPRPSPLPLRMSLPRPVLMDMPPRIQYTKLASSENVDYPPVFYADAKPETIDYLVSIEQPLSGEIRMVRKKVKTAKKVKRPMLQQPHDVYLPTIDLPPPADGRYHEFPTQPILPEPVPSSPYDLPFDNPPEATSVMHYHNHIPKEMPQPKTLKLFKPTFQESIYDFCGCSSQMLINPADYLTHEQHRPKGGDCRITLKNAQQFVASAIEDYSKCCQDCRHKVVDAVAAKMQDLEHNSDMCEYFNADTAGPYVSKMCRFNNQGYKSSPGPKIRQINMNSFFETTPSSPMTINEPTYEALQTIFDPVTVPYKSTHTRGSRPSRSPATESPESKLQKIVDQLRQVLTETVFQKYATDATTVVTVTASNTTIASSPATTTIGGKTWVLNSRERSALLASLISNERVKEFMAKLKVLKRNRQPKQRDIDVDEEASNFVRKLLTN